MELSHRWRRRAQQTRDLFHQLNMRIATASGWLPAICWTAGYALPCDQISRRRDKINVLIEIIISWVCETATPVSGKPEERRERSDDDEDEVGPHNLLGRPRGL